MVLPGIQALFGFQLIAVFSQGFAEKLTVIEQEIRYASIILTVIAVALVMTPGALHLHVDPVVVTRRFVRSSTHLLLLSLFPLAASICLEIYLIGHVITGRYWVGFIVAVGLAGLFSFLWIILPRITQNISRNALRAAK